MSNDQSVIRIGELSDADMQTLIGIGYCRIGETRFIARRDTRDIKGRLLRRLRDDWLKDALGYAPHRTQIENLTVQTAEDVYRTHLAHQFQVPDWQASLFPPSKSTVTNYIMLGDEERETLKRLILGGTTDPELAPATPADRYVAEF